MFRNALLLEPGLAVWTGALTGVSKLRGYSFKAGVFVNLQGTWRALALHFDRPGKGGEVSSPMDLHLIKANMVPPSVRDKAAVVPEATAVEPNSGTDNAWAEWNRDRPQGSASAWDQPTTETAEGTSRSSGWISA